jgi:hypothetical protein
MSRTPENFKRKALELDPKAKSERGRNHPDQWLILDGTGEVIGYTDPRVEHNSRIGWMRAYYTLAGRANV